MFYFFCIMKLVKEMSSTRKLLSIFFLLLAMFLLYMTIKNIDVVTTYVTNIIRKYSKDNVIIPEYTKNHRVYLYSTVSETNDFEPHNVEDLKKIYYTVLNKGWNNFTFYCPYEYETCVSDVKSLASSDNDEFITLINNYVSPYNSYKKYNTMIVDENQVTLSVEKLYSDEEKAQLDNIIDSYISKNIKSKNITQKDLEKIHDFIISRTTYDVYYEKGDKITDSNKATGALIKGTALCSGYTDAFAIFLDKLGVPNFKINSEEHEWNVVYFNDKWSHIDLTWDDDEINKNNNRNFFMIDSKELLKKDKKEHNFNKELYLELK